LIHRRSPSIRDVAERAEVSMATVSNVLAGRRSVAPELVERVHSAVESLGYVADIAARRMRSNQSTIAGVLVPDLANPFFALFVAALEKAALRSGFDLLVASSGEDPELEKTRMRALVGWRPIGIIAIPCDTDFEARQHATAAAVPLVVVDRVPNDPPADVVAVDNYKAAFDGAMMLFQKGHRAVLAVASDLRTTNIGERHAGILAAAAAFGDEVETSVLEVGSRPDAMRPIISEWLNRTTTITAMFSLTNLATLACFGALMERGILVPKQMALLGFDDYEWMNFTGPPISAIRQPVSEMAEHAWAALAGRLREPLSQPRVTRLSCQLVLRRSTGN
jgi:LacI family transcriptional regulator